MSPGYEDVESNAQLSRLVEEEKRFGVDHYDDDICHTGNSHCLKAYMDFRAQAIPKINSYFASFS